MVAPAFNFTAPVVPQAPVAPAVQQPQYGAGPSQDLMALATCADFESGKPPLPIGEYEVIGTRVHRPITRKKGQPFIFEYSVENSNNSDVQAGRQASYFRTMVSEEDITYLAQWLCAMLGAQTKEQRTQVKAMLPFIVHAEITEQPCPVFDAVTRQPLIGGDGQPVVIQPGLLKGRRFHLSVVPGTKESKKNGKVYDEQIWTPIA